SSIGKGKHTSDDGSKDTAWSALLLTSPVCTGPSFSYNRLDQLKHACNYILMRVLTQSADYK
ncbi:unnamed protein product, partial [Hymenolepis diminuta]